MSVKNSKLSAEESNTEFLSRYYNISPQDDLRDTMNKMFVSITLEIENIKKKLDEQTED